MVRKRDTLRTVYGKQEDRYLDLIHQFPLRPLGSDAELDAAVQVVDELIDRDDLTQPEQDYLDVLSDLVEAYEDKTIVIAPVDDAGLLRLLIEGKAVTQVQVAKSVGIAESTISAVLSGKRKLNRSQIVKVARYFCVEPGAFTAAD